MSDGSEPYEGTDRPSRTPPDAPVLFDSGIRRGADAVTALALGAEAVLLGRP